MNSNMGANQYLENSINTASAAELSMMLYNGLVKELMKAKVCITQNNLPKSHETIIRAQDIISEFQVSLDMENSIAQNLMLLYDYMKRRLNDANIKKDIEIIDEVLGFAKELRDAWAVAMKSTRG